MPSFLTLHLIMDIPVFPVLVVMNKFALNILYTGDFVHMFPLLLEKYLGEELLIPKQGICSSS